MNNIDKITELIKSVVNENGYELYHVEMVKEDGDNYLRVYIDNQEGISLDDCVKVSKQVSNLLDEEDPITFSYYLEVSSPGIERELYNNKHLEKYMGYDVNIKLNKLLNGKKKYEGILIGFSDDTVRINFEGNDMDVPRTKISSINLKGEY
ncbi:ribosome maturation factor RimP [Clostridium tepidiprofundi DSM 19306]|uniref:Ribosome maturation factor RimP n=1 Tax=Clostridium tepidiprofundi DSM 19306 TaxID=1121338 RepID=A0A151B7B6_9CLOT|nr:ribosome maturation factor RimP [Clostridium tepidiprofundi]KYH35796.1 ribosome maturation factor RimP [Clostridium tepidiprofundi DSM 19306]